MHFIPAITFASVVVLTANAGPIPQEKTSLSAIGEWTSYIANKTRTTFCDAHKWNQENKPIQTAVDFVDPYWQSAKDTASNLCQQAFTSVKPVKTAYDAVNPFWQPVRNTVYYLHQQAKAGAIYLGQLKYDFLIQLVC